MQRHRGLPKNLPQRKVKVKIYSASPSPQKASQSPSVSQSIYQSSPSRTPERQSHSQSSRSRHHLKSKQKPLQYNPINPNNNLNMSNRLLLQSANNNVKAFDQTNQKRREKEREVGGPKNGQNQFVQTVLGMMGNLVKKNSNRNPFHKNQQNQKSISIQTQNIKKSKQSTIPQNLQQSKLQSSINGSFINKKLNLNPLTKSPQVIGPLLSQSTQPLARMSEQQLFQRCSNFLLDSNTWLTYNGEANNNLREGYGILYFKNKNKFMGAFKSDKACGHGTFYLYDEAKRIMAVWDNDQIVQQKGYLIEQL